MGLDGFTLLALVDELRPTLVNTRVDRIFQPGREEVVFLLRGLRETHTLVMSSDAQMARIHLGAQPTNPATPPAFCMALRKHLGGSRLVGVRLDGLERVVMLDFEAYDELAGVSAKRIYLEIMGRHSNIVLVDADDTIIDAIKRIDEQQSRLRQVLPGLRYAPPPPQPKSDPRQTAPQDFAAMVQRSDPAMMLQDVLVKRLAGISPLMARELLHRAGVPPTLPVGSCDSAATEAVWGRIAELSRAAEESSWQPTGVVDVASGQVEEFSCLPLYHLQGATTRLEADTLSRLVARVYESKAERQRLAAQTQHMQRVVAQALERAGRRREIHRKSMENAGEAETWRVYGELLLTAPKGAERGSESVRLTNYFDPDCAEVTIPLNAALDIRQNAQAYFKKYTKAKRGRKAAEEQFRIAADEVEYLESVQNALSLAASPQDIEEIRNELEMGGYLRDPGRKRRNQTPAAPLRFRSLEGFEILVGRNNLQNDRVTMQMAGPGDLWFHVQKIPGSHVVVRCPGSEQPGDSTLWDAANLAAYFSRSRGSSKVPVDFTARRHVRKPPGSRPGAVLYDSFRTITVDPDRAVLARFNLALDL